MIELSNNIGDSLENAIVITGATDEMEWVESEYDFVSRKYGIKGKDWHLESQSLDIKDNKSYDRLSIVLKNGQSIEFYFDITEFFGKYDSTFEN